VWHIKFTSDIQNQIVTHKKPKGCISNTNLEMMGLILHWFVLENLVNLEHTHTTCWCDKTPMVAWASKLLSTKTIQAARLLQILALHMIACQASPLTTLHIQGNNNTMVDFASHSFQQLPTSTSFLMEFHNCFPLAQQAFLIKFHILKKII